MELIVVRHGDAGPYTQPDYARPLSDLGKTQARSTADQLAAAGYEGVTIWHSPYLRAAETARILAQVLKAATEVIDGVTPDGRPEQFVSRLDQPGLPERLILVSHMPFVANLVALLSGKRAVPFMTAETRILRTETVWYPGEAVLVRSLTP